MKSMIGVVVFISSFMPLHAQQQWCFSKNCPQTPATIFQPNLNNKQLPGIFQPTPALPAYQPIAPLTLSPSVTQFFLYSAPTANTSSLFRLPRTHASSPKVSGDIRNSGPHGIFGAEGAQPANPQFSTERGGLRFSLVAPKP